VSTFGLPVFRTPFVQASSTRYSATHTGSPHGPKRREQGNNAPVEQIFPNDAMTVCVSYPKSGRTWLRTMLAELGVTMSFTHLDTGHNSAAWGKPVEKIDIPCVDADKVVFLYRDPRDTVVSYFYETTIRQKPGLVRLIKFWLQARTAPPGMSEFVRSRRFGIEKIIVFNLLCAEHLRALPMAYEALRQNTVDSLAEILRYIDQPISEDRLREVVANNEFATMQRREANNEYGKRGLQARDPANPNSFKVRRGKVGGWQDELDAETQAFANEMLERYDYFERIRNLLLKQHE
jgi:hypothetical protein